MDVMHIIHIGREDSFHIIEHGLYLIGGDGGLGVREYAGDAGEVEGGEIPVVRRDKPVGLERILRGVGGCKGVYQLHGKAGEALRERACLILVVIALQGVIAVDCQYIVSPQLAGDLVGEIGRHPAIDHYGAILKDHRCEDDGNRHR